MTQPKISVRMYRALGIQGSPYKGYLGDCFLIRVESEQSDPAHILIDFGILMGSAQAEERMRQVAIDIVKMTGGQWDDQGKIAQQGKLDLLIITHEHWDHLSGFSQAQDIFFNGLIIDKLWMAWTEDDNDDFANQLRQERDKRSVALAAVAEMIQKGAREAESSPLAADSQIVLAGLDAFLGPLVSKDTPAILDDGLAARAVKPRQLKTREIIDKLKAKAKSKIFLSPGQVMTAPGEMKTFVLGPPRNLARLKKDKPSTNEAWFSNQALEERLFRLADDVPSETDNDLPFAPRYNRLRAELVRHPGGASAGSDWSTLLWLTEHYFAPTSAEGADLSRRTIDSDWLEAAGQLALKLDADTNNTSLVLAFELPDGTFMLFPGDAQVGNWDSWHDQSYRDSDKDISATYILERVRFYKVSHHGSDNATIKDKGLSLMTHPELVAAIPTDEAFGKQQGVKGWKMPDPRLNEAILAATKGRVFRNDDPVNTCYSNFENPPSSCDLYLEYTVFKPAE
ncbi:MBL fold metallo-hydrolase [Leclercia sp.]|uniref:MBL fold metallo-hydrolase n=1 Tax=Leclercia sp. TaxID=1898428 RepID=UPI002FDDDB24